MEDIVKWDGKTTVAGSSSALNNDGFLNGIKLGASVVAAGTLGRRVSGMKTIGLKVLGIGMINHGLKRSSQCIKRYHGMTAHNPQSAVAIRVGGTRTQSAVATGIHAVQGCRHQSAVASGSQAIHGSTPQPAVATGSQAIDASDPSQL